MRSEIIDVTHVPMVGWNWKAQDMERGVNPLVHVLGMGGCTSNECRGCFFQRWGASTDVWGQWSHGIESASEEGVQKDMTEEGETGKGETGKRDPGLQHTELGERRNVLSAQTYHKTAVLSLGQACRAQ